MLHKEYLKVLTCKLFRWIHSVSIRRHLSVSLSYALSRNLKSLERRRSATMRSYSSQRSVLKRVSTHVRVQVTDASLSMQMVLLVFSPRPTDIRASPQGILDKT